MTLVATDVQRISNWLTHEYAPEIGFCRKSVVVNESGAVTYTTGAVLVPTLVSGAGTTAAVTGNVSVSTATITIQDAAQARAGVYKLRARTTGATGIFDLWYPDGSYVGSGVQGTAFTGGGLSFTLTAGTGTLTAGDAYTITVTGTEKYSLVAAASSLARPVIYIAGTDGIAGSQAIAASTDTTVAVMWRGPSMVKDAGLSYGSDVDTTAEKQAVQAALEGRGILVATQI